MSCKVSFIGLGTMGYPMAGYISKAGHNVTVFNRTKLKAEKWLKTYSGKMSETPAEAAVARYFDQSRGKALSCIWVGMSLGELLLPFWSNF